MEAEVVRLRLCCGLGGDGRRAGREAVYVCKVVRLSCGRRQGAKGRGRAA